MPPRPGRSERLQKLATRDTRAGSVVAASEIDVFHAQSLLWDLWIGVVYTSCRYAVISLDDCGQWAAGNDKLRPMLMATRCAVLLLAVALAGCGLGAATAPNPAADWPMYNRDYKSTRFSPLSEITPKNVANLRQICSYALPEDSTFESSLVAVNGTLYFTTSEFTYAIDAGNCALRWRVRHELAGSGGTVRGVAFAGNRNLPRIPRRLRDRLRCRERRTSLGFEAGGSEWRACHHRCVADCVERNGLHRHFRRGESLRLHGSRSGCQNRTRGLDFFAGSDRRRPRRGNVAKGSPGWRRFHLDKLHARSRFRRALCADG